MLEIKAIHVTKSPKIVMMLGEKKITRNTASHKIVNLQYKETELENIIFDGENVIYDGEQLVQ